MVSIEKKIDIAVKFVPHCSHKFKPVTTSSILEFCRTVLTKYTIENDVLVNFEGKRFPRIQFDSDLHSDLAFELQDPQLAKQIHDAYVKHLVDTLTEPEKELFSKALICACYLFGSPKYPPYNALRLALLEEGFSYDIWKERHGNALLEFMIAANADNEGFLRHKPKPLDELAHVVITTTSASGGNLSVAYGLEKELKKHFRVTIIDVEELDEETDPLKIATGLITCDGVHRTVVQQANLLAGGFDLQLKTFREVSRYIQPILGRRLKKKIMDIDGDFILSTRNYRTLDLNVAYGLSRPGCVLHCDCEVGYYFRRYLGKIHSQLFKIWLPDNLPRVFKPVFSEWKENYLDLSWTELRGVLASSLLVSSDEIEGGLEFVGAPIRPEIHRIKDMATLAQLREKWGLAPGEFGVLVCLGINGVGRMRELFSELLASPVHALGIKYFFVCGKNEEMQMDFEKELTAAEESNKLSRSALKRSLVIGLASGKEVNELLNISLLAHGKPGGSFVEECIKTRLPMMSVFSHELWEDGGQARLDREGYSLKYDPEVSLAEQTENHVLALKDVEFKKGDNRKWKKLIPAAIRIALVNERAPLAS